MGLGTQSRLFLAKGEISIMKRRECEVDEKEKEKFFDAGLLVLKQ